MADTEDKLTYKNVQLFGGSSPFPIVSCSMDPKYSQEWKTPDLERVRKIIAFARSIGMAVTSCNVKYDIEDFPRVDFSFGQVPQEAIDNGHLG